MKKTLALVLALAMTLSLAVCGLTGLAAAEAPDEVTLWHYFDSSNDKQAILDWVEEYNTLQDDIHITATYMSRDELMNQYSVVPTEIDQFVSTLSLRMGELDRLITEAGRMVSELTNHPAIAVSPTMEEEAVRRFEVIQVDAETVVLVLVTTSDIIKNRICHLTFPLSDLEVTAANRALNAHFTNIPLEDLTDERITAAECGAGADITELLVAAIDFASDVLNTVMRRDIYLEGASQILKYPEFHDPGKAMALLDCLSDRNALSLLPVPDDKNPVQIRIGSENGTAPLDNASIIMTSYHTARGAKGLLGVVGPTRMDYAKVAARLCHFAEELNHLLNHDTRR